MTNNKMKIIGNTHNTWIDPKPMLGGVMKPSDFSGVAYGSLIVVGYLGSGKWQVRCSCGMYTQRKSSAIMKKAADMCDDCKRKDLIKSVGLAFATEETQSKINNLVDRGNQ